VSESPKRSPRASTTKLEPNPRTPAELRAYADGLEASARAAAQAAYDRVLEEGMAEVRRIRDAADVVERLDGMTATREANEAAGGGSLVPLTPPHVSSLTSTRVEDNLDIDTMEARTRSDSAKFKTGSQNAGKARDATPFGRWLKANEMAASVWAAAHKDESGEMRWSPMAVRAWMLPAKSVGARAIPEDAAKLIAKESKGAVPATDASWPSGISRPRRRPV